MFRAAESPLKGLHAQSAPWDLRPSAASFGSPEGVGQRRRALLLQEKSLLMGQAFHKKGARSSGAPDSTPCKAPAGRSRRAVEEKLSGRLRIGGIPKKGLRRLVAPRVERNTGKLKGFGIF